MTARTSAAPRRRFDKGVAWLVLGSLVVVGCRGGDDDAEPDVDDAPVTPVTTGSTVPRPSTGELAAAAGVPPPPAPAPITPTIRMPGGVTSATVGAVTTIGADVLAATSVTPLIAVELWDGDRLVDVHRPEAGVAGVQTSFGWVPAQTGLHALTARAVGADGSVVDSMPLWVRVADPIGLLTDVPSGEAPSTTAPGGDADDRDDPADGDRGDGPGAVPMQPAPTGPIPRVTVDPDTCTLDVDVPPDAAAAAVAVHSSVMGVPGEPIVVGVVGPDGGRVDAQVGGSPISVWAMSYDDVVAWSGPPQLVEPPSGCADGGWSGEIALVEGRLLTDTPIDVAYLYLSVNGGDRWQRVPADDQTFVPASPGGADFGGMLPAVAGGGAAIVEAWAWSGGSLVSLGRGVWEPSTDDGELGAGDLQALPGLWTPAESDLDWITPIISSTFDPQLRHGRVLTHRAFRPVRSTRQRARGARGSGT